MPEEDLMIREQIAALVAHEMSIAEFAEWLEEYSLGLEFAPAERLAADAQRVIAEYDLGDWSDDEALEQLGALSRLYWFEQAPKTWTGGTAWVITHPPSEAAGRRHAVGSV
jgi:hypothetical protein